MRAPIPLADARSLPIWRQPIAYLFLTALAMPLSFATWAALLNNFVIDEAGFNGIDIGWLQSLREVPGFLSIGVILVLVFLREQTLGMSALVLLGLSTAVTAFFPSFAGIMVVTFLSSVGFHYFETVNQSLQLQWLPKREAPHVIGMLMAAGSAATLVAYIAIIITWETLGLSFATVYVAAGAATVLIVLYLIFFMPQFEAPHPQEKKMILRKRYWLYYAIEFMAGARRQIFVVFAGFMMVEKFGFRVDQITGLYLINLVANMIFAPLAGRAVARFGERRVLIFEYLGLIGVFAAYAGVYFFGWSVWVAASLYVVDHFFFALSLGRKTYFQKIAAPGDIAPTAAVAFTINHVAAVFLPVTLGYLWVRSPGEVFVLAALMACGSLALACLIPRHPQAGAETVLSPPLPAAAE